jgi:hypothetical protein
VTRVPPRAARERSLPERDDETGYAGVTPADAERAAAFRERAGLRGLIDVHTHFLRCRLSGSRQRAWCRRPWPWFGVGRSNRMPARARPTFPAIQRSTAAHVSAYSFAPERRANARASREIRLQARRGTTP